MGFNKRGNFNRGRSRGGDRGFGGDRGRGGFGGGRGGDRQQMHSAKCDSCGKMCEVPFRPTGEKPVYCSECFRAKNGESPRNFSPSNDRRPDDTRRDFRENKGPTLEQINNKLDTILKLIGANVAESGKELKIPTPSVPNKPVRKEIDNEEIKKLVKKATTKKVSAKKVANKKSPAKAKKTTSKKK